MCVYYACVLVCVFVCVSVLQLSVIILSLSIPDEPDPESRMLAVVIWYLTSFHAGRKVSPSYLFNNNNNNVYVSNVCTHAGGTCQNT